MHSSAIFSTDTGPGNTMMDAFMQQQFAGKYFDASGAVAAQGKINDDLLAALKDHPFFSMPFPKTTGPELFNLNYLQKAKRSSATENISAADTMATLNKFSADTIAAALLKAVDKNNSYKIFSSGGGMHNPVLMAHLKEALPNFTFATTGSLNINPDAKEAILFAVLANECICGDSSYLQKGIPGMPAVAMGKISFPT
jgi:anhydro-N-acetylmuramic acid kinase